MDLGEAGTGKQGNSVFCATLASHRRPFATVDIVQNCLAFPGLRSDPCVDRAALACSGRGSRALLVAAGDQEDIRPFFA
jgi:hypothetical protein